MYSAGMELKIKQKFKYLEIKKVNIDYDCFILCKTLPALVKPPYS